METVERLAALVVGEYSVDERQRLLKAARVEAEQSTKESGRPLVGREQVLGHALDAAHELVVAHHGVEESLSQLHSRLHFVRRDSFVNKQQILLGGLVEVVVSEQVVHGFATFYLIVDELLVVVVSGIGDNLLVGVGILRDYVSGEEESAERAHAAQCHVELTRGK